MADLNNNRETSLDECVDTMETVLFTKIYEKNIGRSKVKDMLPLVDFVKADSKFKLGGVNKFLYNKDLNAELVRMITQN